jgi:hypothetical protein
MDISSSTDQYESWLAAELGSEILKKDLKKKRKEMVAGPFPFLRATYWRWAEMMPSLCQKLDLGTAPTHSRWGTSIWKTLAHGAMRMVASSGA